jgi:hypothetical protein
LHLLPHSRQQHGNSRLQHMQMQSSSTAHAPLGKQGACAKQQALGVVHTLQYVPMRGPIQSTACAESVSTTCGMCWQPAIRAACCWRACAVITTHRDPGTATVASSIGPSSCQRSLISSQSMSGTPQLHVLNRSSSKHHSLSQHHHQQLAHLCVPHCSQTAGAAVRGGSPRLQRQT